MSNTDYSDVLELVIKNDAHYIEVLEWGVKNLVPLETLQESFYASLPFKEKQNQLHEMLGKLSPDDLERFHDSMSQFEKEAE